MRVGKKWKRNRNGTNAVGKCNEKREEKVTSGKFEGRCITNEATVTLEHCKTLAVVRWYHGHLHKRWSVCMSFSFGEL